jgi:hypothetical protein
MSWLMNLFMLGKEPPPGGASSFTDRSPNGVMGPKYNFVAKTPADEVFVPVGAYAQISNTVVVPPIGGGIF